MQNYEATKYYVKWHGGAGWYYPDAQFLDVTREEGEALTPEENNKVMAMCAKYHRKTVAEDRKSLIYAVLSILVAAAIVTFIKSITELWTQLH